MCEAITEIYRDEGNRTKRTRARIKFLVDEWGVERLRAEVETKVGRPLETSVAPPAPIDPHRDHLGIHPQSEAGLYYIGATTLRGRFTADQMIGVADLADRFGIGRDPLHQPPEPDRAGRARRAGRRGARRRWPICGLPTEASTFRRGVISCTGMQFCKLAIVETKDRAAELIDHLERRVGDLAGSLRINLNGCPNACAQYQIADIGLQGGIARLEDGSRVQGFILHIGGHLGEDSGFGRRVSSKAMPADDMKYAVERIVRAYAAERGVDDVFADWSQQQSDARLAGLAGVPLGRERAAEVAA